VLSITKAFALCGTLEEALALSEEVAFLQGLRALLLKGEQPDGNRAGGRNVDGPGPIRSQAELSA
jgi:type I restriction enzyme R subunit